MSMHLTQHRHPEREIVADIAAQQAMLGRRAHEKQRSAEQRRAQGGEERVGVPVF